MAAIWKLSSSVVRIIVFGLVIFVELLGLISRMSLGSYEAIWSCMLCIQSLMKDGSVCGKSADIICLCSFLDQGLLEVFVSENRDGYMLMGEAVAFLL